MEKIKKIILKENPEDFIVEEVIDLDLNSKGKYLIVKITKTNLNTLDGAKAIVPALDDGWLRRWLLGVSRGKVS